MSSIDLHMHSIYSDDGDFSVQELVDQCVKAEVKVMAIADHNSIKAVKEEQEACAKANITCIPAIEIDCTYQGINLHVLGYGIDPKHDWIKGLEETIMVQELACSQTKIELTNALGFHLVKADLDALSSNGVYSGEMFAEALLAKEEYLDHEILKPYRAGGARSDNPFVNFYWDYYAQGKPCYTDIVFPSLAETIQKIHEAKGIAVLAHPGNNLKGNYGIFDEMVALGLDGVEVYSSYHSQEAVAYFADKAKEYNLIMTCGSDYHGKTKPSISLKGYPDGNDEAALLAGLKAHHII